MANEHDILQALADRADEENKEKDALIGKNYQSKKQGKKKKSKTTEKPEREKLVAPSQDALPEEPGTISRATGEMEPVSESSLPLPSISDEPEKDKTPENPFDALAGEMKEKGESLSKPEGKSSKLKGIKSRNIGEEVTKDHAENLISEKKKGGHRKTVIVRTQIVEKERSAENASANENVEPKAEDKLPPSLRLVRSDTGEVYDLDTDLTVGRNEDNDIVIPNPEGHYVSAHHAEIQIQGKDIYIKDLSSTNGTYVNDRKVGSKRIRLGDVVEFADIKFEVVED